MRDLNDKENSFVEALVRLCKAHGLWLGHEDPHGGFIVQKQSTEGWIRQAMADETADRGNDRKS